MSEAKFFGAVVVGGEGHGGIDFNICLVRCESFLTIKQKRRAGIVLNPIIATGKT